MKKYGGDTTRVNEEMNRPVRMRALALKNEKFVEIDTTMSPMDSIRYYKYFLHASFIVTDPHTAQVKAWVGDVNYKHFKKDRALNQKRTGGRILSSVLYTAAFSKGYTPCTMVEEGNPYGIKREDEFKMALYVDFCYSFGYDPMIKYTLRQKLKKEFISQTAIKLGIENADTNETFIEQTKVSLYELMAMYSTYQKQGIYAKPIFITRIEDKNGNLIEAFTPRPKQVLNKEVAFDILRMMVKTTHSGGMAVGIHGYGKGENNVGWHNEIAAYPGTTLNNTDAWFVGLTNNLAGAVWAGGDTQATRFRTIVYGQGAVLALPIWGKFFEKIYADPILRNKYPKESFHVPEGKKLGIDCE